ncbi:MAG TPA: arginine--tRNA ligase [Pyrinomonadaceae bacterium]|mgnify:CR=1 FL=1|nr:arginine--tRNA ligase [Chloracidobacterium sp.]MBL0239419.1 arginine--tRNA ligase [Chloracidobacterium sp.]MBP9936681.1 arginine--tRNA ligase [Pyrinomonadaceae bacterium]HQY68021.1 arginine--tRNA ligase [Pyrinomonadaceae bacterium]HRA41265.1 arginine--tRNA ligase [Pyrinomonadaceae bacterium]
MTITEIVELLKATVRDAAKAEFGIDLDQIVVELPPKTEFGDFAFPAAFELAKQIKQSTGEKQNPRNIAESLRTKLDSVDIVCNVQVAGAGYLNVFIDRSKFIADNLGSDPLPSTVKATDENSPKVCVEHTSVNPNKAAHIGHVRNSVIGDTFQRILKATGKRVEVQNYIDNTGVQVADVVVGFIYIENRDLESIKALDADLTAAGKSFDYYCWDLYAKVGHAYLADEDLKAKRAEVLHAVEAGDNVTAELADYVATRNVRCILDTMERLSIRYDLLPRESEILHLQFWDKAFEQMKKLGVIHFEAEGKHAGCWVMPWESHTASDDHEADKILVRSNGTVTYTGKDIAYQMWKLGILGLDFNYRKFHTYSNGQEVAITTADTGDASIETKFGGGETIYNVIDTRQSYPQEVVKKGVAAISPERGEQASVHLAYEMVALSPAAAQELGFVLSDEDRKRPFIEMSGRKGLGVKADDLIDRLEANALAEVESRHPELPSIEKIEIAHQLAVGALRYFLLKFTRNTVIIFDFKEALSFEGETGCFCQYSAVRANSIFRKLADIGETLEDCRKRLVSADTLDAILAADPASDIWSMAILASRLEETVNQASAANEPAILAKYTFSLAKAFNLFYHNHKILIEPDPLKRAVLVVVADMARRSLTAALATLGIEVPEKM